MSTEVTVRTATIRIENTDKGPVIVLPVTLEDELGRPSAIARQARDLADALNKTQHLLKEETVRVLDTASIAACVRGMASIHRLTTRDLAVAAGVSIQRMRDLKAGRKPYQMNELTGIATSMGKSIVEFMDEVEQREVMWREAYLHDPEPTPSWRQALTEVLEDA